VRRQALCGGNSRSCAGTAEQALKCARAWERRRFGIDRAMDAKGRIVKVALLPLKRKRTANQCEVGSRPKVILLNDNCQETN